MDRTQHPSNNMVLGAQGIESWWTPTKEKMELLKAGCPVKLTLLGNIHLPVKLEVTNNSDL